MKKFTIPAIAFILFSAVSSFAQTSPTQPALQIRNNGTQVEKCATMQHEQDLQQQDPNRAAEMMTLDQNLQAYLAAHPYPTGGRAVITIPVVVHVVWKTASQNISDGQIQSQITVLNQDFTRTNTDASSTPAAFLPQAANVGFNFCLATVDQSGNSTTGIERRQTTTTSWTLNDNVKHYSTGGLDAWDPHNYFNIWVCNLSGGVLGYAEFPTTSSASNTFGAVILYTCFGSQAIYPSGTYNSFYNLGRTTTHEIGHCFNLFHIWGDDGTSCSGTDGCADTPNQADETYGAPSGVQTDACATVSPGKMYQNYMDYSDDVALNLFTNNQKTRMLFIINSTQYSALQQSNRCGVVSVNNSLLDFGFDVHPSPTSGAFTLDFGNGTKENLDISIYNILGEVVFTQHYDALSETELRLNLEGNAPGIYMIEVRTATARANKKIILE